MRLSSVMGSENKHMLILFLTFCGFLVLLLLLLAFWPLVVSMVSLLTASNESGLFFLIDHSLLILPSLLLRQTCIFSMFLRNKRSSAPRFLNFSTSLLASSKRKVCFFNLLVLRQFTSRNLLEHKKALTLKCYGNLNIVPLNDLFSSNSKCE